MRCETSRNRRFVTAALLLAGLSTWGAWAVDRTTTGRDRSEAPATVTQPAARQAALRQVVVTNLDPATVFDSNTPVAMNETNLGPFDVKQTLDVWIVSMYDRAATGAKPFDQRIRLILPDGGVYEDRVTPVDPSALPGRTTVRPDLAGHPIPLAVPARMKRLARALPGAAAPISYMRDATFISEKLPVGGTLITKSNLYGEWRVEVTMERDGKVLGSSQTTFRLTNVR